MHDLLRSDHDRLVIEVNRELIIRAPLNEEWCERNAAERRLLTALSGKVSVPTPQPHLIGHDGWADAYRKIDGPHLVGPDHFELMKPHQRRQLAEDIGTFLAELHRALLPTEVEGLNMPAPPYPIFEPDLIRRTLPLMTNEADRNLVRRLDDMLGSIKPRLTGGVLLHGDLHGFNLVLSKTGGLGGVLDFNCAAIGDPHLDFRTLTGFGETLLDGVVQAYNERADQQVDPTACFVISVINDLHDLTWRAEKGFEIFGGPIERRVEAVRSKLKDRRLI